MEFNIQGEIKFRVDFDIEANSEEEALELAKEQLKDYYHLNVINAYHNMDSIKFDLDAGEYED